MLSLINGSPAASALVADAALAARNRIEVVADVFALAAEAAFVRTRELLLCDMGAEASTEWRAAYDELPPARQVQAVGLASRWGWHDQAIATAARQKLFNDYDLN